MSVPDPPDADAFSTMDSWALGQIAPWLTVPPETDPEAEFARLNASEPNLFILDIVKRAVAIRRKPEAARNANYGLAFDRINDYRRWFADVTAEYFPRLSTSLAVFVGDGALPNPRVPVFAFQKPSANRSLLLPDVDLIKQAFPNANDRLNYAQKACHAIFAGSTTGGGLITAEAVRRDGATARIRAALFFRGNPDVTFKLPHVTQHESTEVVEILKSMDIGVGARIDWPAQFANRFLISIDGNGATCSRLAIALSSNSVLMKYASDSQLYYFPDLRPWRHYLPIDRHEDVVALVAAERARPGLFLPIAENARRFSARFLTRRAALYYTARLLGAYHDLLGLTPAAPLIEAITGDKTAPPAVMLHVQNTGDIYAVAGSWCGVPGSLLAVEGLVVMAPEGLPIEDLSYQSVQPDGTLSQPVRSGEFCGTRGRNEPLRGFRIQLSRSAERRWRCKCWVRYTNGIEAGPFGAGVLFLAPAEAAIEAIRLSWEPISEDPASPAETPTVVNA